MRQFKKYIIDPGLSDTNWKVLFLYLIYVLACNSLSLYTYLLAGSCYGLTLMWAFKHAANNLSEQPHIPGYYGVGGY